MLILTPTMVEHIFEIIDIFSALKNHTSNLDVITFTPEYLQMSSLPISPQFSNLCVFQILIPEIGLTITLVGAVNDVLRLVQPL